VAHVSDLLQIAVDVGDDDGEHLWGYVVDVDDLK
jgi:hypothetical protein